MKTIKVDFSFTKFVAERWHVHCTAGAQPEDYVQVERTTNRWEVPLMAWYHQTQWVWWNLDDERCHVNVDIEYKRCVVGSDVTNCVSKIRQISGGDRQPTADLIGGVLRVAFDPCKSKWIHGTANGDVDIVDEDDDNFDDVEVDSDDYDYKFDDDELENMDLDLHMHVMNVSL